MKRIGIIDLGSNTIRLVIFDVDKSPGKRLRPGQFREILNEKTVAGLSAYVEDGAFTDAGVERAVDVLRDHEKSARNVGCREIRVFATAVLRNCSNSAKVTAEVEGAREALLSTIPMKRLGAAEDVARAVAFFAGEGAGYVTGQVLCVDGGMAV